MPMVSSGRVLPSDLGMRLRGLLSEATRAAAGMAGLSGVGANNRIMTDAVVDDIVALLPQLLQALEFVARHLDPPAFGTVMQQIGAPDHALQAALLRLTGWPDQFGHLRGTLQSASDAALAAFAGLRAVEDREGD